MTCTPAQLAGPSKIASRTASASAGAAVRVCTAMLAGLGSSRTPGLFATISSIAFWIRVRRSTSSGASRWTNPMSNSDPWLPTRCTSLGSRDSVARSRSARPDTTATVVCGRAASARTAATASGSGLAADGSSTIGARVPS